MMLLQMLASNNTPPNKGKLIPALLLKLRSQITPPDTHGRQVPVDPPPGSISRQDQMSGIRGNPRNEAGVGVAVEVGAEKIEKKE